MLLKYIYENFVPPVEFQVSEEDERKKLEEEVKGYEEDKAHEDSVAIAFKNISANLIDLIEDAPDSVVQTDEDIEKAAD